MTKWPRRRDDGMLVRTPCHLHGSTRAFGPCRSSFVKSICVVTGSERIQTTLNVAYDDMRECYLSVIVGGYNARERVSGSGRKRMCQDLRLTVVSIVLYVH
jgi:hypothetical protein